jgi:hypothetical protein
MGDGVDGMPGRRRLRGETQPVMTRHASGIR